MIQSSCDLGYSSFRRIRFAGRRLITRARSGETSRRLAASISLNRRETQLQRVSSTSSDSPSSSNIITQASAVFTRCSCDCFLIAETVGTEFDKCIRGMLDGSRFLMALACFHVASRRTTLNGCSGGHGMIPLSPLSLFCQSET